MAAPLWLQAAVEDFWRAAGEMEPFPRSLETPVLWALPLFIVKVPRLSVVDLRVRLAGYGIDFRIDAVNRGLHGCLVAFGGKGVVMLDGSDPPDELRFSLAHEVAHFLLDYHRPRQRALRRLGSTIVDVLDGVRPPRKEERIDAVLSDVRIGVHTHLMDRSPSGAIGCGRIAGSEFRADRLALELLAPEDSVLAVAASSATVANDPREAVEAALIDTFGLPKTLVSHYARFLVTLHQLAPSLRVWLGMEDAAPPSFKTGPKGVSNFPARRRKTLQR